ncbi:MAG TPA: prephenate dehydrogenase/arogenate dehydrogenase family protein [candidate division Zixibacteria bacterium]|nr:prephenate dehydrogenase/arogenate dehydrogenase family protein [candidate division Zixibacteria bacterium]
MTRLKDATVLIVGLGQIGGSIALALKKRKVAGRLIGHDKDQRLAKKAIKSRIVDEIATSAAEAANRADLIILAAPIREILRLIPKLPRKIAADAVCIDVASTKTEIMNAADRAELMNFIGGHPIAGSEQIGLDAAADNKFVGKTFVLTPSESVSSDAKRLANQFVRGLGAKPLVMSARQHDDILASTSGLPHVLALALTRMLQRNANKSRNMKKLIGGSFTSATRVAHSPVHLITDLLLTNNQAVASALDDFIAELTAFRKMLDESNRASLVRYVNSVHASAARRARCTLSTRGGGG